MEFIDFHTHRETAEGVVTPRSFGIHPWRADTVEASDFDAFRASCGSRFAEAEIIGECGLDKVCAVPMDVQERVFRWQIDIAAGLRKPMVVHCVRAFNELMALRRQNGSGIWVVHGFTGSQQLARQLVQAGIWVSYGAALLDERRAKVRESLSANDGPFLLETDDSPCGIEAVYRAAAEIRKTTVDELASTIKRNYSALV